MTARIYSPGGGSSLVSPATITSPGTVRQMVYNVLDYNAAGNGVADDAPAIQAAINAAQSAGGGTVFVPRGTYNLGSTLLISRSNVSLVGSGQGSVLHANSGLNADLLLVAPPSGTLTGCRIADLFLDGNQNGQSSGHGIHLQSNFNTRIDSVWVKFAHDAGLCLDQVSGQAFTAYCLITNSKFTDGYLAGAVGVRCMAGSELNTFIGCNFDWHSGDQGKGIHLSGGLQSFIKCQCDANGYNLYIDANTKNDFISCLFDRAYYKEAWLTGGTLDNHFVSCKFGYFVGNLQLAGALSGSVTSIPLKTPLTQAIPTFGVAVHVSYGTGQDESFTVTNAGAAAGAMAIPVNAKTATLSHVDGDAVVLRYRGFDLQGGAGPNYFDLCTFQNAQNLTNNFNWGNVFGEDAGCKSRHFGTVFAGGSPQFQATSKVVQTDLSPLGRQTAPGIPASLTVLTNPFPYDCTVYVVGGTVSAVAIGGVVTGLTSGAFRVPAGQTITLTYTAAPSWTWFAD